jgi:hypothetical protein
MNTQYIPSLPALFDDCALLPSSDVLSSSSEQFGKSKYQKYVFQQLLWIFAVIPILQSLLSDISSTKFNRVANNVIFEETADVFTRL